MVVKPIDVPLSSVIEVVEHDKKTHRGEVIAIGPEVTWGTKVGDVIRFTPAFKFPVIEDQGTRYLILQEADVHFIEEQEAA